MNLNLSVIAYHVSDLHPVLCGPPEQALHCRDIRYWDEQTSDDAAYCYLAEWSAVSAQPDLAARMICIGGGKEAVAALSRLAGEALVVDQTDAQALLFRIRDLFIMYDKLDEALIQAILTEQPLQVLLNRAADFFENPVRLFDADLTLVESSNNFVYDENDLAWQESAATGFASPNLTNRLKTQRRMKSLYQAKQAVLVDVGENFRPAFAVNCFGEGERFAFLSVRESQKRLSPLLLGLADHISLRLTPALLKSCGPKFYERPQTVAYISGLLYGQRVDLQIMDAHLQNLGWKKHDKYLLLRIRLSSASFAEGVDGYNKKYYAAFFKNGQSFVQDDTVNIVLNITGKEEETCEQLEEIRPTLQRDGARCGISLPFRDFSMLHEQYLLAGVALGSGRSASANSPYRYYRDSMLPHLFGVLSGILPLNALCHEAVLLIQRYDEQNESQLLISLQTYLLEERSLVRASRVLNIHRNTLVYRLERISEIAKLDYNDAALRMHLLFSCALLQHSKTAAQHL